MNCVKCEYIIYTLYEYNLLDLKMSNNDPNTVIYLRPLIGNKIMLQVRYDNTIDEIKSLLKIKRLIANPVIIIDGGQICPDTYTVRDLQKINPIVIDRKPDLIIPECRGVDNRKKEYHTVIVSAFMLTTFAMYNLVHSMSNDI